MEGHKHSHTNYLLLTNRYWQMSEIKNAKIHLCVNILNAYVCKKTYILACILEGFQFLQSLWSSTTTVPTVPSTGPAEGLVWITSENLFKLPMGYVRHGKIQGQWALNKTKELPWISPCLTYPPCWSPLVFWNIH